jgi:hypothetical protein
MELLDRLVHHDRFFAISLMGEKSAFNIVKSIMNAVLMDEEERQIASIIHPDNWMFQLDEDELMEEIMGVMKQLN